MSPGGKTPSVVALPASKPSAARSESASLGPHRRIDRGPAAVVERREPIARLKVDHDEIERNHWVPQRQLTPVEQAERLKDEADGACKEVLWGLCVGKLDDAWARDPASEAQARTQALRSAVYEHTHLPDGGPAPKGRPKGP